MLKGMLSAFFAVLGALWSLIKIALVPIAIVAILFCIMCFIWYCWMRYHDGLTFPRREGVVREKRHGLLRQLVWDLPKQYMADLFTQPPDFFRPIGICAYCAPMGGGKTAAMTYDILRLQKQYPKAIVMTNYGLKTENGEINHWRDLLSAENPNGPMCGQIFAIDEAHVWFQAGKTNFPPELLQLIAFSRKQRRRLMLSMQQFGRVNKAWREQVAEVRIPHTYLGCFTVVMRYTPEFDSDKEIKKMKFLGMYSFVHDRALRESYCTYKLIKTLSEVEDWQPPVSETVNNTVVVVSGENKKGRK